MSDYFYPISFLIFHAGIADRNSPWWAFGFNVCQRDDIANEENQ